MRNCSCTLPYYNPRACEACVNNHDYDEYGERVIDEKPLAKYRVIDGKVYRILDGKPQTT